MRASIETLRNGDVIEKRVTRHKDGKVSIKRRKIACGLPSAIVPILPGRRKTAPVAVEAVSLPPETKSASKKRRKKAKRATKPAAPKTAAPKTIREHMHHEWDGSKPSYVNTTNKIPQLLRKVRARWGSHVEQFQRDFELVTSSLRSVNLDGAGGGGNALPVPLAQVQAQDRLKAFEEWRPDSFVIAKLVLVDSVALNAIPLPSKYKRDGGRRRMLQEAVEDLASFYTPRKMRTDKSLAAFAKMVEEAKRRYEAIR